MEDEEKEGEALVGKEGRGRREGEGEGKGKGKGDGEGEGVRGRADAALPAAWPRAFGSMS